jgi:translation initiation factor IF-2
MPKKVFELAKEIGVGAIDLVEQLKGLGLNVRNHMVSLSDEEVEKAMAALVPKEVTKKKVTKKKVAKKKAAKKVVKKVTAANAEEPTDTKADTEEVVVKADKPKTVTRKKVIKKKLDMLEETKPLGLQVVSRPEVIEEVAPVAEPTVSKVETEPGSGIFKEKMHTFTPIFTPEAKKKEDKPTTSTVEKPVRTRVAGAPDAVAGAADQKKRMGDLASIVAKKGKAKDITQVRADESLKLATVVTGRQIYTPMKRKRIFSGATQKTEITEVKDSKRVVHVFGVVTAADLADKLAQKFDAFQNNALNFNLLIKKDDYIGIKLASELAAQYGYRVENKAFDEDKVIGVEVKEDKSHLPLRNSIITIMGHVDHGKTTLLDNIRKTKVTAGEAGGITQHIGAYSVQVDNSTLTFLDTPGHAAFGSMRQRGADVTDIVVLVVAADDGVMPQTKESIRYAKKSGSPIIVAVNKMDKEGATPDRVKQELTEFELVSEDWGGDTMFVPISALKGDGIDNLLESIKLQAEMMDLREDEKGKAEGMIIESKIESGRGAVATVLVQKGTLKKGDAVVCGENYGRARSLMDTTGKTIQSAGPSIPVQILGFNTVPSPGDTLHVIKNEREAKKVVENRIAERQKLENAKKPTVASLEDFFAETAIGDQTEKQILKLVVRSDVQGSYEAIRDAIERIGNDEVGVEVLCGGVGAITDNDVQMASSANGYIIGFNMRPVTSARKMSESLGIEIRTYSIIYELINDVTMAVEGMLEPEKIEKYIGRAEVRDTFTIPKIGTIAGSAVIDGKIERGCNIRLLRDGKIMYDGKLSTLKRFKDEVKEVSNGYECGMALEGYDDIKTDDLIEAYLLEEKKRKLESDQTF